MSTNFPQEPTVRVVERHRINPVLAEAIDRVKKTIAEDGYFSIKEFIALVKETKLDDGWLLNELSNEGVVFIKTGAVSDETYQEVLVDIRYMAAAMLLIYSDKDFALKHSVLKYLRTLFGIAEWKAAFPLMILPGLLNDMYEQYGHNFSDMKLADNANLSNEDENVIIARAERYSHPMRELVKSDSELTAAFLLAQRTFQVANGIMQNGRKFERSDVPRRGFDKPQGYEFFWKAAQKILDRCLANQIFKKSIHKAMVGAKKLGDETNARIQAERGAQQKNFNKGKGKINLTRKQRKAKKMKK